MKRGVKIALVGAGFMGRAHSQALRRVGLAFPELELEPVPELLCDIQGDLEAAARRLGWHRWTNRWQDAVENPAIEVVDIATPGQTHCGIATAAARAGKHVLCEKPLALNATEAGRMLESARDAGVRHMVNFNYRRVPAVGLARRLVLDGRLGAVCYFRATYWQDWPLDPKFPFLWRMDRDVAGAGSMADKGSHLIDLARFLVGEIDEVAAATGVFVKERPVAGGGTRQVTTDDAAAFLARFRNGALGLFGTSRMSAGHKNALGFEINGSRGSVIFDLERMNELQVYTTGDSSDAGGFRTVMVTEPCHDYIGHWWPPGHILGWEHTFVHQYYELLAAIAAGRDASPDFRDGLRVQQVLDAVAGAATEKRWVAVPDE